MVAGALCQAHAASPWCVVLGCACVGLWGVPRGCGVLWCSLSGCVVLCCVVLCCVVSCCVGLVGLRCVVLGCGVPCRNGFRCVVLRLCRVCWVVVCWVVVGIPGHGGNPERLTLAAPYAA